MGVYIFVLQRNIEGGNVLHQIYIVYRGIVVLQKKFVISYNSLLF